MRRHLNTLYVTTENAWLRKDGENVVVEADNVETGRVPIHLLGGIVCFGAVGMTPALVGHCARRGVCVSMLGRNGRFFARVEGPVAGNVLLRRAQYRATDDGALTAGLAGHIVTGKLLNQRTVVRRALRDHSATMSADARERVTACERRLTDAARRSARSSSTDVVRGIEGEAAREYYRIFDDLIRGESRGFSLRGRSRRPPLDPVNALLSFLYTLLTHDWSLGAGSRRARSGRGLSASGTPRAAELGA